MERFSSCWSDEDKPYLQPLPDTPSHENGGRCFCDTLDKEILGQVLNDYDQETTDFFRWKVEYDRDYVSELIERNSCFTTGRLKGLVPLERGASGRIVKLGIYGEKSSIIVGKELEIRRLLSETHLKSSAFDVHYIGPDGAETDSEADWKRLRLDGMGWGRVSSMNQPSLPKDCRYQSISCGCEFRTALCCPYTCAPHARWLLPLSR